MQEGRSALQERHSGFQDLRVVSSRTGPSKVRTFGLAIGVTLLSAVGNLALAWGMKQLPAVGLNPLAYLTAMLNPFVAGGILLLIFWLLTRMTLMSWADLSFALPLMALGYIVAALLGHFVLGEVVTAAQWVGTVLIFAGCAVVGTTTHQTESHR